VVILSMTIMSVSIPLMQLVPMAVMVLISQEVMVISLGRML
jgi:hypothetical protein